MLTCPWNFLHDNKKHIISLVGGGGKTTIMYELAEYYAAGVKLGDDRIQYGLGAAFFLPIDSVHRGSGLADLE